MTTDNKTLADAQPGGRVRLGDALPPLPPMGYEVRGTGMGPHDVYYTPAAYTAEQMQDYARAALSAQPSPGGQDALKALDDLAAFCSDDTATVDRHVAVIRVALAARQPVGEPVVWVSPEQLEAHADPLRGEGGHYLPTRRTPAGKFTQPLYAVPSAQAVDLAPASIPDTPEVRDILGRPNFWCSPWANVLRRRGDVIPCKAEEEQAAVIRFMLNHYLAHGAGWAEAAEAEIQAIRYQVVRND